MSGSVEHRPVRIGTIERDAALERLRDAFAQGQLSHEEFDERADAALAARTQPDLEELLADLPQDPGEAAPAAEKLPARPGPDQRSWWGRLVTAGIAVFALGAVLTADAAAVMGGNVTAVTDAEVEEGVDIDAIAIMGGVEVVVPDGTRVVRNGLSVMGGVDCEMACREDDPDAPTVEVDAWVLMGGVEILTASEAELGGD